MQILAPGNSRRARTRRSGRSKGHGRVLSGGFTLVEILLVLLIAGILSTTVLSTLSFRQASSKEEAERLARLIEHAEVMATSLGSPIGLDLVAGQYEFLRWTGTWSEMEPRQMFGRYQLPDGIAMESLADPDTRQAAPRILRFPPTGYPPAFGIRVIGAGHAWLVKGNLAGRVVVESEDSP
jgi:type II secretion system protein H